MKHSLLRPMRYVIPLMILLILATTGVSHAYSFREVTYAVTVTNLTSGQPFSPPVLATHRRAAAFFDEGRRANRGIQEIAENGNNAVLVEALERDRRIFAVQEGDAPLVPVDNPGDTNFNSTATYMITANRWANHLSVATMLICTNDGFTGVDALTLPSQVGQSITAYTNSYDAGTEMNTEDFADIVPPCQGLIGVSSDDEGTGTSNPALAENGVITLHPGVEGGDNLQPDLHGWNDPVAKIEVTRVATYEVTVSNLTSGQAFSPPVIATHRDAADVFTVDDAANEGIKEIAENGNNAALIEALGSNTDVFEFQQGETPLVPADNPGGTDFGSEATYTIHANIEDRYLSLATMLICTNDGFTGLDSVTLPFRVGENLTLYANGYDAGTEINTEDFADIVPPCQGLIGVSSDDEGTGTSNPALAEDGIISLHPNVEGGDDLLEDVHGWTDPVAKIEIKRVD